MPEPPELQATETHSRVKTDEAQAVGVGNVCWGGGEEDIHSEIGRWIIMHDSRLEEKTQ